MLFAPLSFRAFRQPATSTWSGTQWPPSKGGWSHSIRSIEGGGLEVPKDTEDTEEATEVEVAEVAEVEEAKEGWTAAETSRS